MDHSVVDIYGSQISCGVGQLARLSDDQERNLFAIGTHLYHPARGTPVAFFLWSNLSKEITNGHRLCEAVIERELGEMSVVNDALNPKTGNYITIWTWIIDHEKFKQWWKDEKVSRAKGL